MTIIKLKIDEHKFDINLEFYNFLKKITQAKLNEKILDTFLDIYYSNVNLPVENIKDIYFSFVEEKMKRKDISSIIALIWDIDSNNIWLFIFSLKLNQIKDLLLQEAKIFRHIKSQELEWLNQLSLAYDKISTQVAYSTRISWALLSLLFFDNLEDGNINFMSENSIEFMKQLSKDAIHLKKSGLEPNQIFMLLFSESINQSITSSAWASYEDRIKNILVWMGIPIEDISKTHDENDSSTEFDFFFKNAWRSYGISTKRTLRERYKQFIKTAHMSELHIMIEITLWTDLRENIAESIVAHWVYIFVSDEVYQATEYLKTNPCVFPASSLSIKLLESLKSI